MYSESLVGIIQAISSTFGLVLLTGLLGHGIVGFPKYLWHRGNNKRTLAYYEFEINNKNETLDEAEDDLKHELGNVQKVERK